MDEAPCLDWRHRAPQRQTLSHGGGHYLDRIGISVNEARGDGSRGLTMGRRFTSREQKGVRAQKGKTETQSGTTRRGGRAAGHQSERATISFMISLVPA